MPAHCCSQCVLSPVLALAYGRAKALRRAHWSSLRHSARLTRSQPPKPLRVALVSSKRRPCALYAWLSLLVHSIISSACQRRDCAPGHRPSPLPSAMQTALLQASTSTRIASCSLRQQAKPVSLHQHQHLGPCVARPARTCGFVAPQQEADDSAQSRLSRCSCSTSSTAASAGAAVPGSVEDLHNSTGQTDLQRMIAQIPFRRLTIWGVVGFVAYQLSDFFGVREQGAAPLQLWGR